MKTSAIPTTYSGVNFRSRTEARWAALFDLLEIPWEYEPIDLEGYIPDFLLNFGPSGRNLLVEVKWFIIRAPPQLWEEQTVIEAHEKIKKAGWVDLFCVLGSTILNEKDVPIVGSFQCSDRKGRCDICYCSLSSGWCEDKQKDACALCFCACCKRASLLPAFDLKDDHAFPCQWCNCNYTEFVPYSFVLPLWREAGNRVQWKP